MELQLMINAYNCNLEWIYGKECIGLQLRNGCMEMNAWIANMGFNVWTWMYSLKACKFVNSSLIVSEVTGWGLKG